MCCTQNPGEYLLGDPHWKAGVCKDCQNAYVQKASRATSSQWETWTSRSLDAVAGLGWHTLFSKSFPVQYEITSSQLVCCMLALLAHVWMDDMLHMSLNSALPRGFSFQHLASRKHWYGSSRCSSCCSYVSLTGLGRNATGLLPFPTWVDLNFAVVPQVNL